MFAVMLLICTSIAFVAMALISGRMALFALVILYGVYPRLLAVGVGEQGFALTGPRLFLVLLCGIYFARLILNSTDEWNGLRRFFEHRSLVLGLILLVVAKACGNFLTQRFDIAALGALIIELLFVVFIPLVVVTYARSIRDIYKILVCLAAVVAVNEIAVAVEVWRGGSIFSGLVEVQYQTGVDLDLTQGRMREGTYRAMGLTHNPLALARLLCIALPGLMVLAFGSVTVRTRALAMFALLFLLPAMFLTQARAGFAVAIALVSYAVLHVMSGRLSKRLRLAVFAVVAFGIAGIAYLALDDIVSFVSSVGGFQGVRSAESRVSQYIVAAPLLQTSPWFGFGFARNYDVLLDIGNVDGHYLFTALQGGAIGLLCFVWIIAKALMYTRDRQQDVPLSTRAAQWAVRTTLAAMSALMVVYSMHGTIGYVYVFVGLAMVLYQCGISDPGAHPADASARRRPEGNGLLPGGREGPFNPG